MKQLLQNARSGALELVDVPAPAFGHGQILVRNVFSVMSPGTEKMAMDFARKSMLGKARSRPDLVKQVMRKLQHEGPLPTYRTVMNRLDAPQPLGYASAGIVEEVGPGISSFVAGDRIACAGAGYANHAELIVVPENLSAHVPAGLSLDRAAFATLGAIAMQGLRVGDPTLGEVVAVVGLGLIGQLTVQLLLANGCRVYGVDLDRNRVDEAMDLGMDWGAISGEDHTPVLLSATGGHGVDLAIVTAASDRSEPIHLAAELCRMKGRVVAVGATAMDLERRVFYEKELELRMSMSYGPGRYDRRYEELGVDYPIEYVRWTEQRNLQAFLDLAARGSLDPMKMDVEAIDFEQAIDTYEMLARGNRKALAAVFRYSEQVDRGQSHTLASLTAPPKRAKHSVGVAFIGAGNYAKAVLLPALKGAGKLSLENLVTATGPSALRTAERAGFSRYGTDPEEVFGDDSVDLIFITTQHDTHASLAESGLRAGKSIWLEKPVGLTHEELNSVASAVRETNGFMMVGFNRRFSSHARAVRGIFEDRKGPMSIQYVIAAGSTPSGTWLTDPSVGGGRVIGEVCHFVDLCTYLVGQLPARVTAQFLGRNQEADDSIMSLLSYPDGSTASISYLANTSGDLAKERWELHADGQSAICDNFRTTTLPGGGKVRGVNQDKGQARAVKETITSVRVGEGAPIALSEILSASKTTMAMLQSAHEGRSIEIESCPDE